jgi:phosphoribosylanthranilate isomerase
MFIKVCGITTREDALAAVDAGANALGFNFYLGSPRYITVEAAKRMAEKIPDDVLKVGVFVNEDRQKVEESIIDAGLHVAQLHGEEDPMDVLEYRVQVWKAFRVTQDFDPIKLEFYRARAYVLDGPAGALFGGSGEAFDWHAARGVRKPLVIAGGLDATNVGAVIRELNPVGVDACSRLEISPGRKDRQRMREYVDAARAAAEAIGRN